MAENITYHLAQFEGPLDLLLSLIAKNKVQIEDIPISLICDQYFEYLEQAQQMDMELASDFLVMASELVLIKTRMLLPRNEEEEEDPRAGLAAALLEYQRIRGAAPQLRSLYEEYSGRMVKDTDELPSDNTVHDGQDPNRLYTAMKRILENLKPNESAERSAINPIIKKTIVPVSVKIESVRRTVFERRKTTLRSLMNGVQTRSEAIATFIAVLELIKIGQIRVGDACDDAGSDVEILAGETAQTELPILDTEELEYD